MRELRLFPGEVILFRVRRHILWLLAPLLLISAAAVLLMGACPLARDVRLGYEGCPLLVASISLVSGLPFVLEWFTTRFILTNHRLVRFQDPAWLRTREVTLSGLEALSVRQSWLGRVFGYGDVLAAARAGRVVLDGVADPLALRNEISEAIWAVGVEA